MGLLDRFGSMSDDQNQGLLAAASQILQQSGDPRRPYGIGQAMGAGIGSYQDFTAEAKRRKLIEEQAAQQAQARAQQMQMGQFDLSHRQRADAEEIAMQGAYREAGDDPQKLIDAVSRVNPMKGMALRAQLAKQAPKFDTKPQVGMGDDGKPFTYILAEDGTQRRLDGTMPRDELKLANLGGKDVAYNPYALKDGQSFQRTMTPEGAAVDARSRQQMAQSASQFSQTFGLSKERLGLDRQTAIAKAATEKAPTEFQGKSAAFGLRATEAHKILSDLESKGITDTGVIKSVVTGAGGMVPFMGDKFSSALGSGMNALPGVLGGPNEQQQLTEQARRDFINATLRQESGAAIGAGEFENAQRQYFPQPGDTSAVIKQKARNRALVIQGFDNSAGRAAMTAGSQSSPAPAAGGWSIKKVD